MKQIFGLMILTGFLMSFLTGCAGTGKVIDDSFNNLQYSTNGYTGSNYVGLTEKEFLKKIGKAEKEIPLEKDKKLLYGRRNDAYLLVNGKVERSYFISDVVYEVKYNSIGSLKNKNKTLAFVPTNSDETSDDVTFQNTIGPVKNLLKFKGYKVVSNPKVATITIYVKYGSKNSLSDMKDLDPAFFSVQGKAENSYLRYLVLDAKENGKSIWKYKALSEGMKSQIEPAVAAMAFVGYNDIPKSTMGTKMSSISEADPILEIIGNGQN